MLFSLMTVALAVAHQPQERPRANEAQVTIQGIEIHIPHVPSSTDQANGEYRLINRSLTNSLRGIEQDLIELYKNYSAQDIFKPFKLSKEKAMGQEVQFLISILGDNRVDSFLGEIVDIWNGWQIAVVETGSATLVENDITQPPTRNIAPTALSAGTMNLLGRYNTQHRAALEAQVRKEVERHTRFNAGDIGQSIPYDPAPTINWYQLVGNKKRIAIVSNSLVPAFVQAWEPYTEYLNERIRVFAEIEGSNILFRDSEVKDLYNKACVVFLEQIRLSLWICQNVWHRMAGVSAPSPMLKRLGPYFIEPPNLEGSSKFYVALSDIPNPDIKGSYGIRPVIARGATPIYIPKSGELLEPVLTSTRITINMDGDVTQVEYVSGPDYLRKASEQAAKMLKFVPLKRTGFKSEQTTIISINYR